ncbi:hypothetical protein ACP6PL_11080 [Dapis sp. BLCC M126]
MANIVDLGRTYSATRKSEVSRGDSRIALSQKSEVISELVFPTEIVRK